MCVRGPELGEHIFLDMVREAPPNSVTTPSQVRRWASNPATNSGKGGDISEGPEGCPCQGGGGLIYQFRRSYLPWYLGDNFSAEDSPLFLPYLGQYFLAVFCFRPLSG